MYYFGISAVVKLPVRVVAGTAGWFVDVESANSLDHALIAVMMGIHVLVPVVFAAIRRPDLLTGSAALGGPDVHVIFDGIVVALTAAFIVSYTWQDQLDRASKLKERWDLVSVVSLCCRRITSRSYRIAGMNCERLR